MEKLYTYLIESLFSKADYGKHNYIGDVINCLCNNSTIRLGDKGQETFNIDPSIQNNLKKDFDNAGYDLSIDEFNNICIKYGLPKWSQIFKGDFSGYTNGLASKNQGNAFEIDYVNNFEDKYKNDFEKVIGKELGEYYISLDGGSNTKRPLSKSGHKLYLGNINPESVGTMLKDVFIRTEDGQEYNISLKASEKVSFINTGIRELFPEKIFKEYSKTGEFIPGSKNGVDGQDILNMLGVDGNMMAEVFNKYSKPSKRIKSQKDEVDVLNIVKSGCFMDFMNTVVGCGYILVHKIKNKVHIYDLRTKKDMLNFIGKLQTAKVLYPNDGNAKRVDVIIETTGLKLDFEIRAKDGGIYPNQLLCSYEIKK